MIRDGYGLSYSNCGAVGVVFVSFCDSSHVFCVVDSLALYSFV